jgi:hypothetical protein
MTKGATMFQSYIQEVFVNGPEALSRAVTSAVSGRGATVVGADGEVLWYVEVGPKPDENSRHPAIVHYRGGFLGPQNPDANPEAQEVPFLYYDQLYVRVSDKT